MRQSVVHLVVPRFINGREMFCCLFHKWYEDETKEGVRYTDFLGHVWNLLDEEDRHEGDKGNSKDKGDNTLGQGELGFPQVLVAVLVAQVIEFQDIVVQTMVRAGLEVDVDEEGHEQDNSRSS